MTIIPDDENTLDVCCDGTNENSALKVQNAESELTERSIVTIPNDDTEAAVMSEDPRLEQAFSLIRAVIADADKRATSDLVARISGNKPAAPTLFPDDQPDKRAPKGSAAALIDRALAEAGDTGLTVIGIQAKAETPFEKMVSTSALRNWLKEWERKRPQRYRQAGGVWFLAGRGPGLKVVGNDR